MLDSAGLAGHIMRPSPSPFEDPCMHVLAAQSFVMQALSPRLASAHPMELAVLGALAVALVGSLWRLHTQRKVGTALQGRLDEAARKQTQAGARLKELQSTAAAHKQELGGAQRDLATQRKKNHETQLELRQLRDALREHRRRLDQAQGSRVAFVAAPKVAPPAAPEARPAAPQSPPAEDRTAESQAALAAAYLETQRLGEALALEKQAHHRAAAELKQLRRRAEDARRVELVRRSKHSLLEDRLRIMGRQYYDAISELAALRGE
ncbi:MAG: hypothetical protein EOO40_11560, partial [Deltaproteobacteria bacterium]